MTVSLQKLLHGLARDVLDMPAWMVWCDPRGDWQPLLERVAGDSRMGGFPLVCVGERTAGELGSPLARRGLQTRLEAGECFVLLVRAGAGELGWLWAQALLAERIYARSLREQLTEWGWRPQSASLSDDEVAVLARSNLTRDPALWGGEGIPVDEDLLIDLLSGRDDISPDDRYVAEATAEQVGLNPINFDALDRWRGRAVARLLVTQAREAAPALVPEEHELLVPAAHRKAALALLDSWIDSRRGRPRLVAAIARSDQIADLRSLPSLDGTSGPFVSREAEDAVFDATCARLVERQGVDLLTDLVRGRDDIACHAGALWGEEGTIPWRDLQRLAGAAEDLLAGRPTREWSNVQEAIDSYTATGWRVDRGGEMLMRGLSGSSPRLTDLLEQLRGTYRALWEDSLLRWSDLWLEADCPILPLGTAGEWLHSLPKPDRPTALLVLDAFRFDLAHALTAEVNALEIEGANRAEIHAARTLLPSITPLGMAAALPVDPTMLRIDYDTKRNRWQVQVQGNKLDLATAEGRRQWWQEHGTLPPVILAQIAPGSFPKGEGRERLVVYDDAIDKLGHGDELQVMGPETVLRRYASAIQRMREAGWLRILVTTDHGYIHWISSTEKTVEKPAPNPIYQNRRAAVYPAKTKINGPSVVLPGDKLRVAVPMGAESFAAYGHLGYFHGGASLQEWIVPCVKLEWPVEAKPIAVEIEPLDQVLDQRPRVTLKIVRPNLLPQDCIGRRVNIFIRDADAPSKILFRTEDLALRPEKDDETVSLRYTDEFAERNTPLRIEVRDAESDEVLANAASVLRTQLDAW